MLIASSVGTITAKSLPAARRVLTLQLCRVPIPALTHISTRVSYIPIHPGANFALPQSASLCPLRRDDGKGQNANPSQGGRPAKRTQAHPAGQSEPVFLSRQDLAQLDPDAVVVGPSSVILEDNLVEQYLRPKTPTGHSLASSTLPCLRTIATSSSADEVWSAYLQFRDHLEDHHQKQTGKPFYPLHSPLHQVARVLSQTKPKTRPQFLRLLNVLQFIRECGGKIHLHEWNDLIHHAGRGWRKTRVEDFMLAMDLYTDMVTGRSPGLALGMGGEYVDPNTSLHDPIQPNIITYTILIALAARTLHAPSIQRATKLLHEAGLKPNRITHLAMLRYFTLTHQISGVRSTLQKMKEQGLHLGIDGLNACIWAYSQAGEDEVVGDIYRLLRNNIWPDSDSVELESLRTRLASECRIEMDKHFLPDEATFTAVIQCFAYHNNVVAALSALMDMLSVPQLKRPKALVQDEIAPQYTPTMAAFRAIFLGFARHGVPPRSATSPDAYPRDRQQWSYENLQILFKSFINLPLTEKPSRSTMFWIITAFMKTSHNPETLRDVWTLLEARFEGPWGGPNNRLQRLKKQIFSDHFDSRVASAPAQKERGYRRRTVEI